MKNNETPGKTKKDTEQSCTQIQHKNHVTRHKQKSQTQTQTHTHNQFKTNKTHT